MKNGVSAIDFGTTIAHEANLAATAGLNDFTLENGSIVCPNTKRVYVDEQIRSMHIVQCIDGIFYYVITQDGTVGTLAEVTY